MKIGGIQKSSTIDYPGHLACVLFTIGCNLDCFYCHNRALLQSDAPVLDEEEVFSFLKKRRGLLDGVVISGGEPTLQNDLHSFVSALKALGYDVKLDTNGQLAAPVQKLIDEKLIDYLAVDIKALPQDYALVTGHAGFESALAVLHAALDAGLPCEGRTTVYPGCRPETLLSLAAAMPLLPRWRLNVYHMPTQYRESDKLRLRISALAESELTRLLPALLEHQPGVLL